MHSLKNKLPASLLSLFLAVIFISGCQYLQPKSKEKEKKVVARVKDDVLYEEDLKSIYAENMSPEDSLLARKNFITKWIKEKLIFYKALDNLNDSARDKSRELSEYYQSLITYEYEKALVQQRLDTSISNEEIIDYYTKNKENFLLNECIARLWYLHLPIDAPDIGKARQWFVSNKNEDFDLLMEYAVSQSNFYSLNEERWVKLNDIVMQTPWADKDCRNFYKGEILESEDSTGFHLLKIFEIKYKNEISPLTFVRDDIRNIILYSRSQELIKKAEEKIFSEGINQRFVKIYDENF